MVVTQGGADHGEGSSSGFGARHMDDQMQEFISFEITHKILEQTHVIVSIIEEGIIDYG